MFCTPQVYKKWRGQKKFSLAGPRTFKTVALPLLDVTGVAFTSKVVVSKKRA